MQASICGLILPNLICSKIPVGVYINLRHNKQGLLPKSRLYVHLSGDYETAVKVGSRHGKPVIYKVNARQMQADGYVFYQSVNGVWLTKHVPVKYLKKVMHED